MRIRNQILIVLLGASGVLLLVLALLFRFAFQQGLDQYLAGKQRQSLERLAVEFADYYRDYGSFDGLSLRTLVWDVEGDGPRMPPDLVVLDEDREWVLGPAVPDDRLMLVAVEVAGDTVGWVGLPDEPEFRADLEREFEQNQVRVITGLSLVALALALLGAWWLSRKLVQPVEQVQRFAARLANGEYTARLNLQRQDELGELTASMDSLAHALHQASQARERWLADISHELRTPVAVLRGEIEAMEDGVHPLSRENLGLLLQQVMYLNQLLDDLHDLALADAGVLRYRMTELDMAQLVRDATGSAMPRFEAAGLYLTVEAPRRTMVQGDPLRLRQLLDNLLNNSLKYTQAPGEVQVLLQHDNDQVRVIVQDSAPGVGAEDLPRLFDYLFRLEGSRSRATGGAGLGLSICKRIAEAHRGNIVADHSPLGGLKIVVTLPERGT